MCTETAWPPEVAAGGGYIMALPFPSSPPVAIRWRRRGASADADAAAVTISSVHCRRVHPNCLPPPDPGTQSHTSTPVAVRSAQALVQPALPASLAAVNSQAVLRRWGAPQPLAAALPAPAAAAVGPTINSMKPQK